MSLQQVAATNSLCVYRLRDKLLQQVARHVARPTSRFVCSSNRVLSLQEVVQIQSDLILCDLILLQGQRFSQKNSSVHTKRLVAVTCRRNVLLQLVAWCVSP